MYDPEEIKKYIEGLKATSISALDAGEFTTGVDLAHAAKALQDWLNNGCPGAMPVDPEPLLKKAKASAPRQPATNQGAARPAASAGATPPPNLAPAQDPPKVAAATVAQIPPETASPHPEDKGPVSEPVRGTPPAAAADSGQPYRALLEEARRLARMGDYLTAEADLKAVMDGTETDALWDEAERELSKVQTARQARVQELVREAERAEREEPGNPARQRGAWEAVRKVDPDDRGALEALKRLEGRERAAEWRLQLQDLLAPVRARDKDLRAVEEARRKARELINSKVMPDPDLQREAEDVYRQLDELRNWILDRSKGGTSNERAKNFEAAIDTYRKALLDNIEFMADDQRPGEVINVSDALRRARQAYFIDLQERASRRFNEAQASLKDGYPETAVTSLLEAQELLKKVEEGGDDLRPQVEQALTKAQEAQRNKEKAQRLVKEAESENDPEQARSKLIEAKQSYPGYPDVDKLIQKKDELILAKVIRDLVGDLSEARGKLGGRDDNRFDQARAICSVANQRGANLSASSEELEARRKDVQVLLDDIGKREADWRDLQAKLEDFDKEFNKENLRWAKIVLDGLSEAQQTHPEVVRRRAQMTLHLGDDEKYKQAERFFGERSFKAAIGLCDYLQQSLAFRGLAAQLKSRAQARLLLQDADQSYRNGELEQALTFYRQVAGLEKDLPDEDKPLAQQAGHTAERLQSEQTQARSLAKALDEAKSKRLRPDPLWIEWYQAIEALSHKATDQIRKQLDEERAAGIKDWYDSLQGKVRDHLNKGAVREAYELLRPLTDRNLIPDAEPVWRRARYEFFMREAARLLDARQPDAAEEAASQMKKAALDENALEAQASYLDVVRQAALAKASLSAAEPKQGPREAVKTLLDKMTLYSELKQDAEVRSYLIRYLLDARDYEGAAEHARVMAYIQGQERLALLWEQLVKAYREFMEGLQAPAVDSLVTIREGLEKEGETGSYLGALHAHTVSRVIAILRENVGSVSQGLTPERVTKMVEAIDLILRLDPEDSQVKRVLDALKDQLERLASPLCEQMEALKQVRASLGRTLRVGEELLNQARSLRRALNVVNPSAHGIYSSLDRVEPELNRRVEGWRLAADALKRLQTLWTDAMDGLWDMDTLQATLEQAKAHLSGAADDVEEIARWNKGIPKLTAHVRQLTGILKAIVETWGDEDFETLTNKCKELESELKKTRSEINEEKFKLPEKQLSFYDAYRQDSVTGIEQVRGAAEEKSKNLGQWEVWEQQFTDGLERALGTWAHIQEWTTTQPPCLSKSLADLTPLESEFPRLLKQVESQPKDGPGGKAKVLSDKAKDIADRYPREQTLAMLQQTLDEIKAKRQWIEQELKKVEEPLKKLKEHAGRLTRAQRGQTSRLTLNAIRDYINKVKKIDSCNPDVVSYEALLKRLGGKES